MVRDEAGVVDADWICASSMGATLALLDPVVQVIWPMVIMRLSATAMESEKLAIKFTWEAVRTPPTWRATVDKI